MPETMRVLSPHPNILAFYDGRIAGVRFSDEPNWVDDGAFDVGIASYAILSGTEALIYDTHVSLAHARFIRETLENRGCTRLTVVPSHWHLDHIAGNEVFADCPIIANELTLQHLQHHKAAIETGTSSGLPAIAPLILPSQTFRSSMELTIGAIKLQLIQFNIHSDDGTVIFIPKEGILLAGDTLEDTITYVAEPQHFDQHLIDLGRMKDLKPVKILPSHGCPDRIAAGGYEPQFIEAAIAYTQFLQCVKHEPALAEVPLQNIIQPWLDNGTLVWFEPYAEVHASNVKLAML